MDQNEFLNIESQYNELKTKMESGLIDKETLKAELKKLMIRDEDSNYWMIGSNTGKWYIYDGKEWKEKSPYATEENKDFSSTQFFPKEESKAVFTELSKSDDKNSSIEDSQVSEDSMQKDIVETDNEEKKETIINLDNLESENKISEDEVELPGSADSVTKSDEKIIETEKNQDIEQDTDRKDQIDKEKDESDSTSCIVCKSRISKFSVFCNYCGANQKELSKKKSKKGDTVSVSSFNVLSLIFFFGGCGLIFGILFGAAFGIFDILPGLLSKFPQMLIETRGKIQGGLIFAAIGGIGGFIISAISAAFWGSFYNLISYLFGGIKYKVR